MPVSVATNNLGGPFQGSSPIQTINNHKDGVQTVIRGILRRSWNSLNAKDTRNGHSRVITPFRAVNNLGDYLGRQHYSCGGPNPVNSRPNLRGLSVGSIISNCDATNIAAASCNSKFVPDSSDYITFKKQRAINANYNDSSNGGDQHNGSYVNLMSIRRR